MNWTKVESWRDLPTGNWLVKVDKASHGLMYHTASIRPNVAVIGGLFSYDQHRVVAYAPIPELLEGAT
jgi:hypothetical protein